MKTTFKLILLFTVIISINTACEKREKQHFQIDHVILAINNLEKGIEQFKDQTDLVPEYGGGHPTSYTHNATVVLSEGMYIEFLAPKDDLDTIPEFFKELETLTPIGFAISANNIVQLKKRIEIIGFQTNGIENWSRETPKGELLEWKLLMVSEPALIMNPFFIHWSEETKHPAMESDIRAYLKYLELRTPYKEEIEQIFVSSHSPLSQLKLTNNHHTKISFTLQTPKGLIKFEK